MVELKKYSAASMDSDAVITVASGPVIIEDNKVLLSKDKKDDFWKFPGGTVRDNESFQETAIREAKEEAGLKINLIGEPFVYIFNQFDELENKLKFYVLFQYKADVIEKGIAKENDLEIKYFEVDNLPENIAPNIKPAIDYFTANSQ